MAQLSPAEIVKLKPIGKGLDPFRDYLTSTCENLGLPCSIDSIHLLDNEVLQNLFLDLVTALLALPASRALRSVGGTKNLFGDLLRLTSAINSDDFDVDRLIPLLSAVLNSDPDALIWDKVYTAVAELTPPPRPLPYLLQTPLLRNTSSFVNSSEYRKYVDDVLKEELGSLFVGVPDLYKTFFGDTENLEKAGLAVF